MHYYFEHINMCAEYAARMTAVLKGNRDESNKAPEKLFDWNDDSMAALEGSTGRGGKAVSNILVFGFRRLARQVVHPGLRQLSRGGGGAGLQFCSYLCCYLNPYPCPRAL